MERRLEGCREWATRILQKSVLTGGDSQCKGPVAGLCLDVSGTAGSQCGCNRDRKGMNQERRSAGVRLRSCGPWWPLKDLGFFWEPNGKLLAEWLGGQHSVDGWGSSWGAMAVIQAGDD